MSFLTVNGIRTHYQRMPAKNATLDPPPQVVFIHGLGYDSLASFYLTLVPPFAAAGLDVLAYDLRAHGRTDRPDSGYRLPQFTADLVTLLDTLGVTEPVHLVGNSFGGTIAFDFAVRHPERVRSLVSIESEPATAGWAEKMVATLNYAVDGMETDGFLSWVEESFGAHQVKLTRIAATMIRATTILDEVPSGPFVDPAALAALRCPVLSIMGSAGFHQEDPRGLERLVPRCRTEIIDGHDHSVLVGRHHEIRPMILDWIAQHHEPALLEA